MADSILFISGRRTSLEALHESATSSFIMRLKTILAFPITTVSIGRRLAVLNEHIQSLIDVLIHVHKNICKIYRLDQKFFVH